MMQQDVGSVQFNTDYLKSLALYGIAPDEVAAAGCYAYDLAEWRLRHHILTGDSDIWTRFANYHSRTRRFNVVYRPSLMTEAKRWGGLARGSIYDVRSIHSASTCTC